MKPATGFYTVPEFAEFIRVSERQIWREIEDDKIIPHKFGRRTMISEAEARRYIAAACAPRKQKTKLDGCSHPRGKKTK